MSGPLLILVIEPLGAGGVTPPPVDVPSLLCPSHGRMTGFTGTLTDGLRQDGSFITGFGTVWLYNLGGSFLPASNVTGVELHIWMKSTGGAGTAVYDYRIQTSASVDSGTIGTLTGTQSITTGVVEYVYGGPGDLWGGDSDLFIPAIFESETFGMRLDFSAGTAPGVALDAACLVLYSDRRRRPGVPGRPGRVAFGRNFTQPRSGAAEIRTAGEIDSLAAKAAHEVSARTRKSLVDRTGLPGGTRLVGGTGPAEVLHLSSTAHPFKGQFSFGVNTRTVYDERAARWGIAGTLGIEPWSSIELGVDGVDGRTGILFHSNTTDTADTPVSGGVFLYAQGDDLKAKLDDGSTQTIASATAISNIPIKTSDPSTPAEGDIWLHVTGTSPSRVLTLRVYEDGGAQDLASVTY